MVKRIEIFGAGISGSVAAIHLARQGFEVHLYDREERIGGNPAWTPSIQTTNLNLEKTSKYVEIDLEKFFRPVKSMVFYRYGRKTTFSLPDIFSCERGPRATSLDYGLGKLAVNAGVIFHPSVDFSNRIFQTDTSTIIATGLNQEVYQKLGLPHVPIYGYRALAKTALQSILFAYMEKCTRYDFAYLTADNGLLFGLLFSRFMLAEDDLTQFKKILKNTESIDFNKWEYSFGAIPTAPHLFWGDKILTGTLAGMIDPYILHGVSGALISGKIAARAVREPNEAEAEFHKFIKNFSLKKSLKWISSWLPFKRLSFPAMMLIDSHLQGVGFVR